MWLCRCGRGTGMSLARVVRVGEVGGSERVVMFDIDGGLADLSVFTHLLTVDDSAGSRRQAWQRFFDQVGHATVVEPGRDVVEAVAGLGFVVVYSTTRPVSCAVQTRLWLGENGFPPGRALLCRSRGDVRAAVDVKAGHCRAVGRWLSALVDDESEAVDALRSTGVLAHCFDALSGLGVRELRGTLSAGSRDPLSGRGGRRPRGHGHRGVHHRSRGTVAQGAD
ncbi:hypothetical protein RW1_021_00150 [Rhodococcus wratislaviensis NBRC 100605]|uniref:Uncharacterized protein n=2 Tax=Rhodococcus wratislaviensis TaxID=44752 RepID=X0PRB5_RHOWR|nr:hypothetical protein RW1_021_00150 [Rhodococcus wratislaviensis NBRC 100605]